MLEAADPGLWQHAMGDPWSWPVGCKCASRHRARLCGGSAWHRRCGSDDRRDGFFKQGKRSCIAGCDTNPVRSVARRQFSNARERYLSAAEASRLRVAVDASVNPQLKHIVWLLLLTDARVSGWITNRYKGVMIAETELAMVQRHVRQGQERVSRQVAIIAHMALQKQSTDLAERLLLSFEWIQQAHQDHLDRLTSG